MHEQPIALSVLYLNMTKAEYIKRYGIETYELHNARTKEDSKNS